MSDNTTYTPGTGVTIAADEVGGVLHQRVKISIGTDGNAQDCSVGNPLPAKLSDVEGTVGSAIPTKAVTVGGTDGTNLRVLKTDSNGELQVSNLATAPLFTRPGRPTSAGLTNVAASFASSGDNTLVSATASQTTRVFRLVLVFEGDVGIKFRSGSTDLTGVMKIKNGGSITLDFDGEPWFVTATNEAFIANLDAAVNVRGFLQYVKG